jgi:nucleotide-binding universal stress UspA family protein
MNNNASLSTRTVERSQEAALELSTSQHRVVIGIAGSSESARALEWAITYAQQTGAVLVGVVTPLSLTQAGCLWLLHRSVALGNGDAYFVHARTSVGRRGRVRVETEKCTERVGH